MQISNRTEADRVVGAMQRGVYYLVRYCPTGGRFKVRTVAGVYLGRSVPLANDSTEPEAINIDARISTGGKAGTQRVPLHWLLSIEPATTAKAINEGKKPGRAGVRQFAATLGVMAVYHASARITGAWQFHSKGSGNADDPMVGKQIGHAHTINEAMAWLRGYQARSELSSGVARYP